MQDIELPSLNEVSYIVVGHFSVFTLEDFESD